MESGGCSNPSIARFSHEIYRQILCIWFFVYVTKILLANFQKKSKALAAIGSCHVTSSRQGAFAIFEVLRAYLKEFSIFFREICMIARSYQALAADIKSLVISILVSLETRLKVLILAIFDDFWHFSSSLF